MSQKIILYGKPWCPMVGPVQRTLKNANVDYAYIDILQDPQARVRVREINDGYESVPTILFPDGSILTEPSSIELRDKLTALGHDVPTPTARQRVQSLLDNPLISVSGLLILGAGVRDGNNVLLGLGVAILALVLANGRFKGRVEEA